jgi:hypothetical protein
VKKTELSTIKETLKLRGIEPLYEIFTNSKDKLPYRCKNDHIFYALWVNLKRGHGCVYCAGQKVDWQKLEDAAAKKKGILLSKVEDYKNNKTKLLWKCAEGHEFKANWANIQSGKWCPTCAGNKPKTVTELQEAATAKNGKFLSHTYTTAHDYYEWECDNGHKFKSRWHNVNSGKWCPDCQNKTSKPQKEIADFINELGFTTQFNCKLEGKLEVDIFIPESNIGIEYHGLFWHSDYNTNFDKKLHLKKYLLAKEKGITLIQLFSDEWLTKPDVVKSLIKAKLGVFDQVIKAKNCKLKESTNYYTFFDKTHLAGGVKAIKAFSLWYNEEIVAALSLRPPYTKKHKGLIEIARFATKLNTRVDFAFSRLLKAAMSWAKSQGYKGVLSYADCRISTGKVYQANGFEQLKRTSPNYFYTNFKIREGRFKHKKSILLEGSTELEQNRNLGWFRVFDAGSETFIKLIK